MVWNLGGQNSFDYLDRGVVIPALFDSEGGLDHTAVFAAWFDAREDLRRTSERRKQKPEDSSNQT